MIHVSSIPALNRFWKFCKKQKKAKCFKTKVSSNQIVISISNFDEFFSVRQFCWLLECVHFQQRLLSLGNFSRINFPNSSMNVHLWKIIFDPNWKMFILKYVQYNARNLRYENLLEKSVNSWKKFILMSVEINFNLT